MYSLPVAVQAAPPSPHGSLYALPQHPNASPNGNVMYISSSPAMAPGSLPPQSTGQIYVQQPQQYIQQQPQPQLVHQTTGAYVPYVQGGPSPLLPMLPLSQQPSPQVTCMSIGDPIVSQGSSLIYLSTDQQLPTN
jgi:hypothetical protein